MKKKEDVFLLGVTGGIASGKSTVARMLEKLGAPIIDFDILARQVVEPGKPAWKDIVDYFGRDILDDSNEIDRKKLSGIVFGDDGKRGELEKIIHPRIGDEFNKQLKEIKKQRPDAIIQAVVPLLYESGIRDRYNKIIVVHVPRELQIERLIVRDEISREQAIDIINSQMSIDDKTELADYVIYNDGSREETNKQVGELWNALIKIRKNHSV